MRDTQRLAYREDVELSGGRRQKESENDLLEHSCTCRDRKGTEMSLNELSSQNYALLVEEVKVVSSFRP